MKKPKQPCINIVCFQWYIDWECLRWWHPSSASRKGWYPILDGSSRVCEWISHIEEHQVFKLWRDEINAIRTGLDSVNLTEFLLINERCILMVFPFTSDNYIIHNKRCTGKLHSSWWNNFDCTWNSSGWMVPYLHWWTYGVQWVVHVVA